jgi:hypothetical protein
MTKTVEITLYQFDELSAPAKEKAVQRYHEHWMDHDWYDCTYDHMKEEGAKKGFRIDDIRFSGFHSQGDGASWCGAVSVKEWIASKPTAYQEFPTTQIVLALIDAGWVDDKVMVSFDSHHYCHENTMSVADITAHEPDEHGVELITEGMFKGADVKELAHIVGCEGYADGTLHQMDIEIVSDCRGFAKEIYRALEADYEAQTTEEAIGETYAINDVWFHENGARA